MVDAGGPSDGLLIRAKCAPHFRRILYEMNPSSPLLRNYAHGSCPAGKYYCRITPSGDVTPCPYMPVSVGNLRDTASTTSGARRRPSRPCAIRSSAAAAEPASSPRSAAAAAAAPTRPTATILAEDPACGYQPGGHGGAVIDLPATHDVRAAGRLSAHVGPGARERLQAIPSFARGMVVKAVEAYARGRGDRRSRRSCSPTCARSGAAGSDRSMSAGLDDRFRIAARAYLVYGAHLPGRRALSLAARRRRAARMGAWCGSPGGAGARGARSRSCCAGLARWFERWILCRRDFARVLAAVHGLAGLARAQRRRPLGDRHYRGALGRARSLPLAGAVFLIVTVAALLLIGRAAWARGGLTSPPSSGSWAASARGSAPSACRA